MLPHPVPQLLQHRYPPDGHFFPYMGYIRISYPESSPQSYPLPGNLKEYRYPIPDSPATALLRSDFLPVPGMHILLCY